MYMCAVENNCIKQFSTSNGALRYHFLAALCCRLRRVGLLFIETKDIVRAHRIIWL